MSEQVAQTLKTEIQERIYLFDHEVYRMVEAVKKSGSTYAKRDALLILLAYKHGLRACEVASTTWNCINMVGRQYTLTIERAKQRAKNKPEQTAQALVEDEIRLLKEVQSFYKQIGKETPYVFASRKGTACITTRQVHEIVANAGKLAGFDFEVHPHMLRHATGYKLANSGYDARHIQEYLGHKNIQNTVRYTKLSTQRTVDMTKAL